MEMSPSVRARTRLLLGLLMSTSSSSCLASRPLTFPGGPNHPRLLASPATDNAEIDFEPFSEWVGSVGTGVAYRGYGYGSSPGMVRALSYKFLKAVAVVTINLFGSVSNFYFSRG